MIKFVDMTPALRASDPSAPPTCAFLNTETGRFCEHGGTGEHLFTSADDVARHGPPQGAKVPADFFHMATHQWVRWCDVPPQSLILCDDGDYAYKRAENEIEWVRLGRLWWSLKRTDGYVSAASTWRWAIVAVNLRGDETAEELRALAGVEPA